MGINKLEVCKGNGTGDCLSLRQAADKVGLVIVTCDRTDYLKQLLQSLIQCEDSYDHLVIVNDGQPILEDLNLNKGILINNEVNLGVAKNKNKGLKYLQQLDCKYYFVIEDDMLIINKDIFKAYIDASAESGIQHFMFAYHGPANKGWVSKGVPTPRKIIDYGTLKLSLNQHCVGAFCFYTKECLDSVGVNDEKFLNAFEHVEHSYRLAQAGYSTPYWWWADLANSLEYIQEQACSEESSSIRPRVDWSRNVRSAFQHFQNKHGFSPVQIPDTSVDDVIKFLKYAKNKSVSSQ